MRRGCAQDTRGGGGGGGRRRRRAEIETCVSWENAWVDEQGEALGVRLPQNRINTLPASAPIETAPRPNDHGRSK